MTNGTIMTATSVLTVATQILSAASTALSGSSSGPVDRIVMAPGIEVAFDGCECGLLALTTGNAFPSRGPLLTSAGDTFLNCEPEVLAINYSLVIARCVPTSEPDDDTMPPTPAQLITAFAAQEEDAFLVREAVAGVLCALVSPPTPTIAAWVINERVPLGPLGGCSATQLTFKVAWYRDCHCGG